VKAAERGACGTLAPGSSNRHSPRKKVGTISNISKTLVKTRFSDVVTGIQTGVSGKLTLGGVGYTPTTLAAVFTEALTAMGQADTLHSEWSAQVAVADAAIAKAETVYVQLRNSLIAQTDEASLPKVLGGLGMELPKARSVSSATKAGAAVKAAATRKLRGTVGPKQKKSVKSNVQVSITAEGPESTPAPAAPTTPSKS
jgi:hypothetical protein